MVVNALIAQAKYVLNLVTRMHRKPLYKLTNTSLFQRWIWAFAPTPETLLFQLRPLYSKASHSRGESWRFTRGQRRTGVRRLHLSFLLCFYTPSFHGYQALSTRAMSQKGPFSLRWCGPPLSVLTLQRNAWHSRSCAYAGPLSRVKKGGEGEREKS